VRVSRRALAAFYFLVGFAIFVHVINQTGPAEILTCIRTLGAEFLVVLAISPVGTIRALWPGSDVCRPTSVTSSCGRFGAREW
jgi:hypothetical protein